jgi:transcriptional regulator with XRE-family HTH domain
MTSSDLKAWQAHMHYTQAQAADALGVSLATYKDWLTGVSRTHKKTVVIDKRTALACAAIAANLSEWIEQ